MRNDNLILNRTAGLLCGILLLVSACSDDDDHTTKQIVNDDLESSIEWQFVNVAPASHILAACDNAMRYPRRSRPGINGKSESDKCNG